MTQGDDLVPVIVRREGVKRDESATFGNFEMNDGFDGQTLGMEWMTLRAPATDFTRFPRLRLSHFEM